MKINFTISKDFVNSYVFSLSIFLSAITIPIKHYMSSGLFIWIMYGVILGVAVFVNNVGKIKRYFISFMLFFNIFFVFSFFISDNAEATIEIYVLFFKFSVLPLFLFQYVNKNENLFVSLSNVAKLTYFILLFSIPLVIEKSLNYMTFGVAMAYTLIFIYFNDVRNKKFNIINFIIVAIGLCALFIFANRMSFVIAIFCLFLMKILFSEVSFFQKLLIVFLGLLAVFMVKVYLYDILKTIQNILSLYDIYSYSIHKLIMMLDEDLVSASGGRDGIFSESITMIYNNMFLPYNVGYYQVNNHVGAPYPHNLFLDLLLVVGLPGLILLTILYGQFIWKVCKLQDAASIYFIFTISFYSILRLSLSGTFWSEPLFWLPFFAYLSFKSNEEKQKI